jgi:hypothetical protein
MLAEQGGGHEQHGQVDQPGGAERDQHVEPAEPQQLPALGVVGATHPRFGQRGMQVDHVRHHGGADDARHQQQAAAAEAGHQASRDPGRAGSHGGQVVGEAEEDQA